MKKLTILLGVLLFLVLQNAVYPQVLQQWVGTYNGSANASDNGLSVAYDAAGNVYTAGSVYNLLTQDDFIVIKYNASGVQQWIQTYNGTGNAVDKAEKLAVDAAGNVYVTGTSAGLSSGNDIVTLKYNTAGVQQWIKSYNGPGNGADKASGIVIDSYGNAYVTGACTDLNSDYITIKYNSSGTELWVQRYNSTYNSLDAAMDIKVDGTGNVYVTGMSHSTLFALDFATIKYNSAGSQIWVKTYNGPSNSADIGYAMALDASGNIYVTGASTGTGTGYDYVTIKYDTDGNQQWLQRYDYLNLTEFPVAIALDGTGNVLVTGSSGTSANPDYLTIKYNTAGTQEWVKRYNGSLNNADYSKAIAVDGFGNIYITGNCYNSAASHDILTIKYNSAGSEQWLKVFNGTLNSIDYGNAIAVGACNNVFVTGQSYNGSATGYDIVTVKYLQPSCPPVLLSPENNSFDVVLTPVLDWNASPDAVTYNLQIANNSSFTNPLIDLTGMTNHEYSVPANMFTTNTHYFWRVNATNSAGTGLWSAVWNFWTYSTPTEKIQSLITTIDSLKAAGILNKGQANSLIVKLNTAQKKIQSEQFEVAIKMLEAFKNEVEALISANILPPAIGANLILRADQVIDQLNSMYAFDNFGEPKQSPSDYSLEQNYPNPFNPSTTIKFGIKKQENGLSGTAVKLVVFDITGRTIVTLVNDVLQEGIYDVTFKAVNLPSGIYFYKLTAGSHTAVKRMILMK
ncbi:MAG: SBBP repeat-containing protein [Ignavibacteria bacterium]|nr:SBBP repeat-containing protein [Ignavibacteria bacterium]